MGTLTPEAHLHLVKDFTADDDSAYVRREILNVVEAAGVAANMTGLRIEFNSDQDNFYSSGMAKGLDLDFSGLVVNDDVTLVGVSVNMADEVCCIANRKCWCFTIRTIRGFRCFWCYFGKCVFIQR